MEFKEGDKVVCINADNTRNILRLGEQYEVHEVWGNGNIELSSVDFPYKMPWRPNRFVLASSLTKLEKAIYGIL